MSEGGKGAGEERGEWGKRKFSFILIFYFLEL